VVLEMMSTELVALAMGRDGLVADTSQACGELRCATEPYCACIRALFRLHTSPIPPK